MHLREDGRYQLVITLDEDLAKQIEQGAKENERTESQEARYHIRKSLES